jgi:hypothetical protein
MWKYSFLVLSAIISLLPPSAIASAYEGPPLTTADPDQNLLNSIDLFETKLSDNESLLRGKPVETWTAEDTQAYLESVTGLFFYGLKINNRINQELPADLHLLLDQKIISRWPLNPWNDWQEIECRTDDASFHAGDLLLQPCPRSEWSIVSWFPPKEGPKSFMLSIFGNSKEYTFPYDKGPQPKWSVFPAGTAYYYALTCPSATESYAKMAEKAAQEEADKAGQARGKSGEE